MKRYMSLLSVVGIFLSMIVLPTHAAGLSTNIFQEEYTTQELYAVYENIIEASQAALPEIQEDDLIINLWAYEVGRTSDGTILVELSEETPMQRTVPPQYYISIMMEHQYGRVYQPWTVVTDITTFIDYFSCMIYFGDGTGAWAYKDYLSEGGNVHYGYLYFPMKTYASAGEYEISLGDTEIITSPDGIHQTTPYAWSYSYTLTVP